MSTEVYLPGPNGLYMAVAEVRIGYVHLKHPYEARAYTHRRMVCEGYWWREAWFQPEGLMMAAPNGLWYCQRWMRVDDPSED